MIFAAFVVLFEHGVQFVRQSATETGDHIQPHKNLELHSFAVEYLIKCDVLIR